jgi:hypothetical protein
MLVTTVLSVTVLGQSVLPGSEMGLQEARQKAGFVAVAEVAATGDVVGGVASLMVGIRLDIKAVLKGDPSLKELSGVSAQAGGREQLPRKGDRRIFFIRDYRGHPAILKVAPETKESLAALKDR